jgi:hypothetical protein
MGIWLQFIYNREGSELLTNAKVKLIDQFIKRKVYSEQITLNGASEVFIR